ncbi:MAG: response regulator [Myxococcales bacterium]|nr:response regulator [Myxococcales bacterium]
MIVGRALKKLGWEVVEACHGAEALERLDDNEIDLAMVDWNMPVMNGIDFVEAVRKENKHDAMRVVMVTTESGPEQMIRALQAGANEYIMKPFTDEVLRAKLTILGLAGSTC